MSWNPPNPYAEFDDDDYLAGFYGWAAHLGYLLEQKTPKISTDQHPAIIPMMDACHHIIQTSIRAQNTDPESPHRFMHLLGATFADDLHEAIEHAIRYAPEVYLELFGVSSAADMLSFFYEAALTYPTTEQENTGQESTAQESTAQESTAQESAAQESAAQESAAQESA